MQLNYVTRSLELSITFATFHWLESSLRSCPTQEEMIIGFEDERALQVLPQELVCLLYFSSGHQLQISQPHMKPFSIVSRA